MNKKKVSFQLFFTLLLISFVRFCLAEIPSHANFVTSTSHTCIGYECEKSLYSKATLDIDKKNLSLSQYKAIIEKHINRIQTSQTTYPGFDSTIKEKIPKDLKNKALHCHKAKSLITNWNDSNQRTTTLKFRHECWQLKVSNNKSNTQVFQKVVQIPDIIYTVTITRTATGCSSTQYSPHPTKFECFKNNKLVSQFRKESLLPLDDVTVKNVIAIDFDNDVVEFVLLDITDENNLDISDNGITSVSSIPTPDDEPPVTPEDSPANPINEDPEHPEIDDDVPETEHPEIDDDVPETEHPEIDDDVPETEHLEIDDDDVPETEHPEIDDDDVPETEHPDIDDDDVPETEHPDIDDDDVPETEHPEREND